MKIRYCPACGHLGPLPKGSLSCCPDGSRAARVPEEIARQAAKGIQIEHIGRNHKSGNLLLRKGIGTAEGEDGNAYEISLVDYRGSPLVRSERTGKYFELPLEDLINLAIARGINDGEPDEGGAL